MKRKTKAELEKELAAAKKRIAEFEKESGYLDWCAIPDVRALYCKIDGDGDLWLSEDEDGRDRIIASYSSEIETFIDFLQNTARPIMKRRSGS